MALLIIVTLISLGALASSKELIFNDNEIRLSIDLINSSGLWNESGDYLIPHTATNTLRVPAIASCTYDIETDANGEFYCGSADAVTDDPAIWRLENVTLYLGEDGNASLLRTSNISDLAKVFSNFKLANVSNNTLSKSNSSILNYWNMSDISWYINQTINISTYNRSIDLSSYIADGSLYSKVADAWNWVNNDSLVLDNGTVLRTINLSDISYYINQTSNSSLYALLSYVNAFTFSNFKLENVSNSTPWSQIVNAPAYSNFQLANVSNDTISKFNSSLIFYWNITWTRRIITNYLGAGGNASLLRTENISKDLAKSFSNFKLENVSNSTPWSQIVNAPAYSNFQLANVSNDTVGYSELFDFLADNISFNNASLNAYGWLINGTDASFSNIYIGGGIASDGITLAGGSGYFVNVFIENETIPISGMVVNGSWMPSIDAKFNTGNSSNRWLNGNWSGVLESVNSVFTNSKITNLYDSDGSDFFDESGCGTTSSLATIDETGAITCQAIDFPDSDNLEIVNVSMFDNGTILRTLNLSDISWYINQTINISTYNRSISLDNYFIKSAIFTHINNNFTSFNTSFKLGLFNYFYDNITSLNVTLPGSYSNFQLANVSNNTPLESINELSDFNNSLVNYIKNSNTSLLSYIIITNQTTNQSLYVKKGSTFTNAKICTWVDASDAIECDYTDVSGAGLDADFTNAIVNVSMLDNNTLLRTFNITNGNIVIPANKTWLSSSMENTSIVRMNITTTINQVSIVQYNDSCAGFRYNNSVTAGGLFSCMA